MRIKEDYVVKDIVGNTVIVPVGQAYVNGERYIQLNSERAFIVRNIKVGKDKDEIVDLYADVFSEDIEEAIEAYDRFIDYGKSCGFIE